MPFVLIGVALVLAYNLEWFGGALHTDEVFALSWGAFPVLVGGFAQTGSIELPVLAGAAFATATSLGPALALELGAAPAPRGLRVEGSIERAGGEREMLDVDALTAPAEAALRALAAAHILLALAIVALRLNWVLSPKSPSDLDTALTGSGTRPPGLARDHRAWHASRGPAPLMR